MPTPVDPRLFDVYGFHIERQLLGGAELAAIVAEYEAAMREAMAAGHPAATEDRMVPCLGPRTPALAALIEHPVLVEAASALLGPDMLGAFSSVNHFAGDTPWHTEIHEPGIDGLKVALYLEPVDASTGALRVLPGSHQRTMTAEIKALLHAQGADVPAFVCATQPGDAVVFDTRMWHASFGGRAGRPSVQVRYFCNPVGEVEERAATEMGRESSAMLARYGVPHIPMWNPDWVHAPNQSPTRQHWVRRMRQLGWIPDA